MSSPFPRAQAIAAIVFPELVKDIFHLGQLGKQYEVWMLDRAQVRLGGGRKPSEFAEGLQDAWQPYYDKFRQMQGTLISLAAKSR